MTTDIANKLTVLLPQNDHWDEALLSQTILPIAETQVINFINKLSQSILTKKEFRIHPELMAMGFWMRKAHISQILNNNISSTSQQIRLARGVVFHIAPSNVDSIFIYSWFLSMLMGNMNVIRLSSKSGDQINLLLQLLNELFKLPEFKEIACRQVIVSYGHDDKVTEYFSAHCDMRVIWGGDSTINRIRQIPIAPSAIDLSFTDKFSMSLINATAFLRLDVKAKDKLAKDFINDAFWFGQMACSSPRLILWKGTKTHVEQAKEVFWESIYDSLKQEFTDIAAADIVNKLVVSQSSAIESKVAISNAKNNLINRLQLDSLQSLNTDLHCGAGLFYEFSIEDLKGLLPIISRKIQTVGYMGFTKIELKEFIENNQLKGIDRFVPIGNALDFSPTWDGYDLLNEFTRIVDIH